LSELYDRNNAAELHECWREPPSITSKLERLMPSYGSANYVKMKASRHPQEPARLNALRGLDILDSPRETAFDEVVDLAAKLCGTPISVINLIDAHRQWFKAETGLGVRETPLDTSICAHVILEGDFVEIPDTLADPRMNDNPLCLADPGLRFYAGAVLRTADGHPIGTLCVLDHAPSQLTELQRETLKVLAAQVMAQLSLRIALRTEELLRKEIDHRVKNSLQMVMSFAQLQRKTVGPSGDAALLAVVQQIGAVALLHDVLSHKNDHAKIDIAEFMAKLVAILARTLPGQVKIESNFQALVACPDVGSSLGVIINELVTNSLKHSFVAGEPGIITLAGMRDDTSYRITCSDNGTAKGPVSSGTGLGALIMDAAIQKIGGELKSGPIADGYRSVVTVPIS